MLAEHRLVVLVEVPTWCGAFALNGRTMIWFPTNRRKMLRVGRGGHQRFAIVPWQPTIGMRGSRFRVAIEVRQVIEWIGHAELARSDQAHQRITNPGSFSRSIKEGIFAVKYRFFECPFTNVVIKGCSRFSQEQRQRLPMVEYS